MENNITLTFNLSVNRDGLAVLARFLRILQSQPAAVPDMPLDVYKGTAPAAPAEPVTPARAAEALAQAEPQTKDFLDAMGAEPVALWPDDKYLEAVAPCIKENREKASTFLDLFVKGNRISVPGDRPKMRDVPQGLRGQFVEALYQYFGKQYNGVA